MPLEPIGRFPTPYGVQVDVYPHPHDPEEYVFDLDAAMTFAGVHGDPDRQRCKAALNADLDRNNNKGTRLDVFLKHGGRVCPKALLVRPSLPAYPTLPKHMDPDIPIEAWVTAVMDRNNWFDRSVVLLDIIGSNVDRQSTWAVPAEVKGLALSILMTATLEHLVEDEIECLEAAAFYALTVHEAWSDAGLEWLRPFRRTWFRDWVLARPAYQEFAKLCRKANADLPIWIVKGTSA